MVTDAPAETEKKNETTEKTEQQQQKSTESEVAKQNTISDQATSNLATDLKNQGAHLTEEAMRNSEVARIFGDDKMLSNSPLIVDDQNQNIVSKVSKDAAGHKVLEVTEGDKKAITTYGADGKPLIEETITPNGKTRVEHGPNGETITTAYDASGKLVTKETATAAGDTTKLTYDENQRIKSMDQTTKDGMNVAHTDVTYDAQGNVASIRYSDSWMREGYISTADGGKTGSISTYDEMELIEGYGSGFYTGDVKNVNLDQNTGKFSYESGGGRYTQNVDGTYTYESLPADGQDTVSSQPADATKSDTATAENNWYETLIAEAYNQTVEAVKAISDVTMSALDSVGNALSSNDSTATTDSASTSSVVAPRTTDPKALAAIDDLPINEWNATVSDLQLNSPEVYKAYMDQLINGTSDAFKAPEQRDYSGIDSLRTSMNEQDRALYQTWLDTAPPEVVGAYHDWSVREEAKFDAMLDGYFSPIENPQPNANPDQWLADLSPEARNKFLTGFDATATDDGGVCTLPDLVATDKEFEAFLANQDAGKTEVPTYNGKTDYSYVDNLRYSGDPREQQKYEYWRQNASPEKVAEYDEWNKQLEARGKEDYGTLFAGMSKEGQNAYIAGIYKNAAMTGDFRQVDDYEKWLAGDEAGRRPLPDSALMKDFTWTEKLNDADYAAAVQHMLGKTDGEFNAYSKWLDQQMTAGGAILNGGKGVETGAGLEHPAYETQQAGTTAGDIVIPHTPVSPEVQAQFTKPDGSIDYEKMQQYLSSSGAAIGRQPADLLIKGADVKVETIKDTSGTEAVKIESGTRSQTWVAVPGKAGEFALQPPSPDGSTPRAVIDTTTQPPQIKEYVFNKQEQNGAVSTITTDRNGNPTRIAQADGSNLNLQWSDGKLQAVQRVTADSQQPVDLIRREKDGTYVQVAKVNTDGTVTQLPKEQQVQLATVQVGKLGAANGAAFGDISVVEKPQVKVTTNGAGTENGGIVPADRNTATMPEKVTATVLRTDGQVRTLEVPPPANLSADALKNNGNPVLADRVERAAAVVTAKAVLNEREASATVIGAGAVTPLLEQPGRGNTVNNRPGEAVVTVGADGKPIVQQQLPREVVVNGGQGAIAQNQQGEKPATGTTTTAGQLNTTLDRNTPVVQSGDRQTQGLPLPNERGTTQNLQTGERVTTAGPIAQQAQTLSTVQQMALEQYRATGDAKWQQVAENASRQLQQIYTVHQELRPAGNTDATRNGNGTATTNTELPRTTNVSDMRTGANQGQNQGEVRPGQVIDARPGQPTDLRQGIQQPGTTSDGKTIPGTPGDVRTGTQQTGIVNDGKTVAAGGQPVVTDGRTITNPGQQTVVADGKTNPITQSSADRDLNYILQRAGGRLGEVTATGPQANNVAGADAHLAGKEPKVTGAVTTGDAGTIVPGTATNKIELPKTVTGDASGTNASATNLAGALTPGVKAGEGKVNDVVVQPAVPAATAADLLAARLKENPALAAAVDRIKTYTASPEPVTNQPAPVIQPAESVKKAAAEAGVNNGNGVGNGNSVGSVDSALKPAVTVDRENLTALRAKAFEAAGNLGEIKRDPVAAETRKAATEVSNSGGANVAGNAGADKGGTEKVLQPVAQNQTADARVVQQQQQVQASPEKVELQQRTMEIRQQIAEQIKVQDQQAAQRFLEKTAQLENAVHNAIARDIVQNAANQMQPQQQQREGNRDAGVVPGGGESRRGSELAQEALQRRGIENAGGNDRGNERAITPAQVVNERLQQVNERLAQAQDPAGQRYLNDVRHQLESAQAQILRAAGPGATLDPQSGVIRTADNRIFTGGGGEREKSALALEPGVSRLTGRDGNAIVVGGREISIGKDGAISPNVASQLKDGVTLRDASGREIQIGRDANVVQRDGNNYLVSRDGREIALSREGTITRVDTPTNRPDGGITRLSEMPGGARVVDARGGDAANAAGGTRQPQNTELGRDARDPNAVRTAATEGLAGAVRGGVNFDPNARPGGEPGARTMEGGRPTDRGLPAGEAAAKPANLNVTTGTTGGVTIVNTPGRAEKGETGVKEGGGGNQKEVVVNTLSGMATAGSTAAGMAGGQGQKDPSGAGAKDPTAGSRDPLAMGAGGVQIGPANLPGVQISGGKVDPSGAAAGAGGTAAGGALGKDPGGVSVTGGTGQGGTAHGAGGKEPGGVSVTGGTTHGAGGKEPGGAGVAGAGNATGGSLGRDPGGVSVTGGAGGKEPGGVSVSGGAGGKEPGGVSVSGGASGKEPGGAVTSTGTSGGNLGKDPSSAGGIVVSGTGKEPGGVTVSGGGKEPGGVSVSGGTAATGAGGAATGIVTGATGKADPTGATGATGATAGLGREQGTGGVTVSTGGTTAGTATGSTATGGTATGGTATGGTATGATTGKDSAGASGSVSLPGTTGKDPGVVVTGGSTGVTTATGATTGTTTGIPGTGATAGTPAVDPVTGAVKPTIDPTTGLPIAQTTQTGQTTSTGQMAQTGQITQVGQTTQAGQAAQTGQPGQTITTVDPKTGLPVTITVQIDPNTGLPIQTTTTAGQTTLTGTTTTGSTTATGNATGQQTGQTGQTTTIIDPKTGLPVTVQIDPGTGLPVTTTTTNATTDGVGTTSKPQNGSSTASDATTSDTITSTSTTAPANKADEVIWEANLGPVKVSVERDGDMKIGIEWGKNQQAQQPPTEITNTTTTPVVHNPEPATNGSGAEPQPVPSYPQLTDQDIHNLQPSQMATLSEEQIHNITPQQIVSMTSDQFVALFDRVTEMGPQEVNVFVNKFLDQPIIETGGSSQPIPVREAILQVLLSSGDNVKATQPGSIDFTPTPSGGDVVIRGDGQPHVSGEVVIQLGDQQAAGNNGGRIIFEGEFNLDANTVRIEGGTGGATNEPGPVIVDNSTITGNIGTVVDNSTTTGNTGTVVDNSTTTGNTGTVVDNSTTTGNTGTVVDNSTHTGNTGTVVDNSTHTGNTGTVVDNSTHTGSSSNTYTSPSNVVRDTAINIILQTINNAINDDRSVSSQPATNTTSTGYSTPSAPSTPSSPTVEPAPATASASTPTPSAPPTTPATPYVDPYAPPVTGYVDPYAPTMPSTNYGTTDPYVGTNTGSGSIGTNYDSATGVPLTDPYMGSDRGLFPQSTTPQPDPYLGSTGTNNSGSWTSGASNADSTPLADPYTASANAPTYDPSVVPLNPADPPAVQPQVPQDPTPVTQQPLQPDPYIAPAQPAQQTAQVNSDPAPAPQQAQPDPTAQQPQPRQPEYVEHLLPPNQDPYIGQAPPQPERPAGVPDVGQMINEFIGTPQQQPYGDITDGRIEVGYMSADQATDWRTEVSEAQNEYAEQRLEEQRRREEEQRRREEEEKEEAAKRYADSMMLALANRREQEQIEAARRQHLLQEQQAQRDLDATRRQLQEQELLVQSQRQKYVVLAGDTLESIALKKLRDRRLAPLVYEINKAIIPVKVVGSKKLLQLRPRMVIKLPSLLEVKRYKSRLFGRQNTKFEYDPDAAKEPMPATRATNPGLVRAESTQVPWPSTRTIGVPTSESADVLDAGDAAPAAVPVLDAAAQKRRANIEAALGSVVKATNVQADGRLRYVCRLGDTLRSLAVRHPALKDLALWRLVAEVNGLSVETDDKGNPVAQLKRGMTIVLPSAAEIEAFRGKTGGEVAHKVVPVQTADPKTGGKTTAPLDIVCKECPQCRRLTVQSATICPACAFPFEGQRAISDAVTEELSGGTVQMDATRPIAAAKVESKSVSPAEPQTEEDAATSLLLAAGMKPVPHAPEVDRGIRNVIAPISETCRIVSFGNMDDGGVGFRTRLEVRQEEFWLPVVRYEINEDASWRHTFNLSGTRKTTRIDLPSRAAKEMAEHDLSTNAEKYAEAFLAGKDISDVI